MLIRYKKMYRKIAMGLLSFIPNQKDLRHLQMTLEQYEAEENHQLFLWKEEGGIIGLIGVLEEDHHVQIQHISVNPSHRHQGFGNKMVEALKECYPGQSIMPEQCKAVFTAQQAKGVS